MEHDDRGPDGFTPEQRRQLLEMLDTRRTAIVVYTWIGKLAKWLVTVAAGLAVLKAATSGYFRGIWQ